MIVPTVCRNIEYSAHCRVSIIILWRVGTASTHSFNQVYDKGRDCDARYKALISALLRVIKELHTQVSVFVSTVNLTIRVRMSLKWY